MASINENLLVKGARGHVGKQFVYRKHGDNTTLAKMPVQNKDAVPTEKQAKARELFTEAADYALGAMASPDLKKEYEKKATPGKSAYNLACRDYLKAPEVKGIDATKYKGLPGQIIIVRAKDDVRVAEVRLRIHSAAGVLVEEGNALLDPINRNRWNYTTTANNAVLAGSLISATALDLPGNAGSLEITI